MDAPAGLELDDADRRVRRWNYWMLAQYLAWNRLGLVLVQPDTVLPVLLLELTSSPILCGTANALYLFFWTFPQSLSAYYTKRMTCSKRAVTRLLLAQSTPWLLLALVLALVGSSVREYPGLMIGAIYLAVIVFALLGGATIPGYMALMGKTLAPNDRIRLLGTVWLVTPILTLFLTLGMGAVLRAVAFPFNFAAVFVGAFVVYGVGLLCWYRTREPADVDRAETVTLGRYYQTLYLSLRHDGRYRRFVLAITFAGFSLPLLMPSLATYAVVERGYDASAVAGFLAIQTILQSLAGGITAHVLSRRSALLGLFLSSVTMVALSGGLVAGTFPGDVWSAYALAGLSQGFFIANYQTAMFEASRIHDATTTIGLTNTLRAPFYALGSILGGVLDQRYGFQGVVVVAGFFSLLSLASMWSVLATPLDCRWDDESGRDVAC